MVEGQSYLKKLKVYSEFLESIEDDAGVNKETGEFEDPLGDAECARIRGLIDNMSGADDYFRIKDMLREKRNIVRISRPELRKNRLRQEQDILSEKQGVATARVLDGSWQATAGPDVDAEYADIQEEKSASLEKVNQLFNYLDSKYEEKFRLPFPVKE